MKHGDMTGLDIPYAYVISFDTDSRRTIMMLNGKAMLSIKTKYHPLGMRKARTYMI